MPLCDAETKPGELRIVLFSPQEKFGVNLFLSVTSALLSVQLFNILGKIIILFSFSLVTF